MKKTFSIHTLLLLVGMVMATTWVGCDKDDDGPGGNPGNTENKTEFTMSVNGTNWTADPSVKDSLINNFFKIDSLPLAIITNDSLIIGASAKVGQEVTSIVMLAKPQDINSFIGTYPFNSNILNIPKGQALGIYKGKQDDISAYIFGIQNLDFEAGSQLTISEYKDNKISGEFTFKIVRKTDQGVFYDVKNGKFKNLKVEKK